MPAVDPPKRSVYRVLVTLGLIGTVALLTFASPAWAASPGQKALDKGVELYRNGRFTAAADAFREAIQRDPGLLKARENLGWAYWRAGRLAECRKVWTQYAALYPDRPEPFNLLTQLHLAQKKYPAAIQTIKKSLALAPDQPKERLKLAKALLWDRQFDQAKRYAALHATAYPDDVAIQVFWGEVLMRYHDFQAAEAQWRKVLALGPPSPRVRYYWIRALYNLGQYDAALLEARKAIATDGPQQDLLQLLIEDALARDDAAEAVRWYELAVEQFPERPAFWVELAELYRERGMMRASDATLRRAKQRHPEHFEIFINVADNHRLGKRYDKALREYRELFARYPQNRDAFIGLFNTLVEANHGHEALDLLEHNQTTFLTDSELDMDRARVLLAQGQTSRAQALFMRVASPEKQYVPIVLYHGLGGHPRSANLAVALFDSQLKALRDAGYTAITVRELAEMIDGRQPFPRQPIVITFDDGRFDSFQLGDPVLAKYGMKATMFVPSAHMIDRHPFFADWDLIRRYARTGRWDMQGHGHEAHDPIPIDESGQTGGFLVNRQWLEADQRLETPEEYAERLEADYQETIRLLTRNVPNLEVVAYAFPYSEAGQSSVGNASDAATLNERLLFRYFRYGFVQDSIGYNEVNPTVPTMLRRLNVPRSWDGERLLAHLATQHPRHKAQMHIGTSWMWAGQYGKSRRVFEALAAENVLLKGPSEYQLAEVAFQEGQFREARRHLETAIEYGERSSRGEQLMARLRWENQPRVDARFGTSHDSDERVTWWNTLRVMYPLTNPVTLWTDVGVIRLTEDGLPALSGREVGVGTEWRGTGGLGLRAQLRHRSIEKSPNSLNVWLDGMYERGPHELRLRWASEDVDTVQAHEKGLQSRGYTAAYRLRPTPNWDGRIQASIRSYDDGNDRVDWRTAITRRLPTQAQWRVGGALSYSDTGVQSLRYYTPEDLIVGRAIVAYRQRWESGWELAGEAGVGWADDALRGNRMVSDVSLDALQVWGERLQSQLGWAYARNPGYQSWWLEGSVSLRF
ncbi:MAG TPA: tetratricopeptide repeat protein [Nitrospiria bacterium]|nr:tetratricopeptide repeat protein [Nitrospiria bacterium]